MKPVLLIVFELQSQEAVDALYLEILLNISIVMKRTILPYTSEFYLFRIVTLSSTILILAYSGAQDDK